MCPWWLPCDLRCLLPVEYTCHSLSRCTCAWIYPGDSEETQYGETCWRRSFKRRARLPAATLPFPQATIMQTKTGATPSAWVFKCEVLWSRTEAGPELSMTHNPTRLLDQPLRLVVDHYCSHSKFGVSKQSVPSFCGKTAFIQTTYLCYQIQ